jgi:serine/threonine protein kinase
MSPDVKSIFGSALAIDAPDRRAAYLDEVCGPDTGLREEVDGLLAAFGKAGDFMCRPAAEVALGKAASHGSLIQTLGAMIGPYKLLEQVGEGGMGLVFVADQQHPVRRRVALKLIKPGMDSRQIVARFEAERQALAMMDHPNIAKVLDGGATPEGGPYFVMELVKGLPITDHCDKNCLGTRQRLELFLDVCHAVQHAHQKGIIHRDLKPSNILVEVHDVRPVAKIIDFGIAKAIGQQLTDKTLYTALAHMVGTPMYMSPEQAGLSSLDVDTRSDVYSLGVLLYELLTGTTPFENETLKKADYDEMRRIIREDEPPKPSTRLSTLQGRVLSTICERHGADLRKLQQQVRGELDWIVMKCLEKERGRRFETAKDLALDVQRYLRDEQVHACPPTVGYRLTKFMRRNKRPLVAAGLMLLVLVGGIVGTTLGMLRATYEANQKEQALTAVRQNERDARAQLFQALWNQARALRHSAQVGARTESLKALDGAAALAQTLDLSDKQMLGLRNEAIACLSQTNLTLERHWRVFQPTTRGFGFDAALRSYAVGEYTQGETGDIVVRRVQDDQEVVRLAGALDLRGDPSFHFSTDGTRLVARDSADQGSNRTTVWDLHRRQPLLRMTGALAFDLHPGGRLVAAALRDHSIRLFDLGTDNDEGTPLPSRWQAPRDPYLCFNATGTKLVVAGGRVSGSSNLGHDHAGPGKAPDPARGCLGKTSLAFGRPSVGRHCRAPHPAARSGIWSNKTSGGASARGD